MEQVCNKKECTGCGLCANLCDFIQMREDTTGFFRPVIDQRKCIDCGKCVKNCPAVHPYNQFHPRPLDVLAAWNKNEEVLHESSSGGAFSAFAEALLETGGVVFGAAFDSKFHLRHIAVTQKEGLAALRKSKYVQSEIGLSYRQAKDFLESGKEVLFTGTPCQIVALNRFLKKKYENLYTADVICYGVPSSGHLKRYIAWLSAKLNKEITAFQMRNKEKGWGQHPLIIFKDGSKKFLRGIDNAFIYSYYNALSIQTACNECPYMTCKRSSDITIGDFWKLGEKEPFPYKTSQGISLLLVNSPQGQKLLKRSENNLKWIPRTLEEALIGQSRLRNVKREPWKTKKQEIIQQEYCREKDYTVLAKKYFYKKKLAKILSTILPQSILYRYHDYINRLQTKIKIIFQKKSN
ncbi:MAG: Coenzyme F420 hydrogenase/dehydrogenase, beta subunit C-terminal domain [Lentisphaeria bacterium]